MSEPMISVPRDAFALLFAYCHTSQTAVPAHIRAHPDYPGNHDGKRGHLSKAIRPYVEQAFAEMARKGAQP